MATGCRWCPLLKNAHTRTHTTTHAVHGFRHLDGVQLFFLGVKFSLIVAKHHNFIFVTTNSLQRILCLLNRKLIVTFSSKKMNEGRKKPYANCLFNDSHNAMNSFSLEKLKFPELYRKNSQQNPSKLFVISKYYTN